MGGGGDGLQRRSSYAADGIGSQPLSSSFVEASYNNFKSACCELALGCRSIGTLAGCIRCSGMGGAKPSAPSPLVIELHSHLASQPSGRKEEIGLE